jgi:hypothetical protein
MAERDPGLAARAAASAYDQDYGAWIERQAALLQAGRWLELDLPNLIDEVESLGRSDFRGLVSAIEIVTAHMLKWDYQPGKRGPSWIASIDEHRSRIADALSDSPSYRSRIAEAVARAYRPARAIASRQTKLPLATFPSACPYDWAEITEREHHLDS